MTIPENRAQLAEPETSFTGAGPHDAGSTFPVEATFTGRITCVFIIKDAAAEILRLCARFVALLENGAIVHAETPVIEYVHADWTAATTATPPDLSISSGEVFVTFVGIVGADVHATLDTRGIKT